MEQKKYYIQVINKEKAVPEEYFINLFEKNINWTKIDNIENEKELEFTYVIGDYLKNIDEKISYHYDTLHRKYLTNKSILYKTIQKEEPENYKKFMVYHTDVDINNLEQYKDLFKNNKLFILRPSWQFERAGIYIFDSFDNFKKFMEKEGRKNYEYIKKRYPNDEHQMVLSEYIKDTLLYNNRVLDFRVFFLITYVNNIYRAYLIKPIIMNLGAYERDEKFDPSKIRENITVPGNYADYFFTDLKKQLGKDKSKYIMIQIKHILSFLLKIIKKYNVMKPYPEQNNVYEVFGVDFIVDSKLNVKLIEFNEKTGLGGYKPFLYNRMANAFIHSTVNKLYNDEYKIEIDKNIKKKIIRISTHKDYLKKIK